MSRAPRPRFNFPSWNYGYTLGPPDIAGPGGYSMFYGNGGGYRHPGAMNRHPGAMRGARGPFRGGPRPSRGHGAKMSDVKSEVTIEAKEEGEVEKKEDVKQEEGKTEEKEQGQEEESNVAAERPLAEILHGRNAVMFCNDQSKFRSLHMEWEQVSETGPPHDKTFTWSLKMGELTSLGSANSKKGAKNKAAEEMAKKLDKLPKPNKRNFNQMNNFYPGPRMGPVPPPWVQHQMMKRQRMQHPMIPPGMPMGMPRPMMGAPQVDPEEGKIPATQPTKPPAAAAANTTKTVKPELPKLINQSQNNPISRLYEYCKKKKLPEPLFEVVAENVLETRKTHQGFLLKKTEFTMQCSVQGKKFVGNAMNKKAAKTNAAAAAWADVGAGIKQDSIDSLLQSQRSAAS